MAKKVINVVETPVATVEETVMNNVVETPVEENVMNDVVETTVEENVMNDVVETTVEENVMNDDEGKDVEDEEVIDQEKWEELQEQIDTLDVEGVKIVIDYCKDRLESLQKEEIEALEAQMREIQMKLFNMKGGVKATATATVEDKVKRSSKNPIVNPDNPMEVYKFGKTPIWLKELMKKTGKTKEELRG